MGAIATQRRQSEHRVMLDPQSRPGYQRETQEMQFESSSMQLSITEEDIARGYIDVPGTNRLTLNSHRSAQQLANISLDYEPDPFI